LAGGLIDDAVPQNKPMMRFLDSIPIQQSVTVP
jgi:hypothetical protein